MSDLGRFVEDWCTSEYPPAPVDPAEFEQVTKSLNCVLPAIYLAEVTRHGLPSPTIELLDVIVERDLPLADINQFLAPAEIVETTREWRSMGLPEGMLAFATDCSGNLFAFRCEGEESPSAVWLFDHDFGTITKQADDFPAWLRKFSDLKPRQAATSSMNSG